MMTGSSRNEATSAARMPPRAAKSSRAAADLFQPVTFQPAFSRLAAMGPPIRPSPTKPALFRLNSSLASGSVCTFIGSGTSLHCG
ncbi:hypothetical protein D9M72_425690 [compost metagenome]